MPEEKGLYWVRVDFEWMIADWQGNKDGYGQLSDMDAFAREGKSGRWYFVPLDPLHVQAWAARVALPGEG